MTAKTTIANLPDVTATGSGRNIISSSAGSTERARKTLWLELLSATNEPDRAILRCAVNLLSGAEPFEIDPVTGVSYTVAGFERAAASWAEEYAWYDRGEDPESNPYRHDLALEGREVQARYAAVHPELTEPAWFSDHGPRTCIYCLMDANEAAGLPFDTGVDRATGGIAKSEPAETVAVALPGMETAA